jgi:nucleotide-binding universal stress UspA family protein
MKRILVGVDGSKESREAAQFAAGIARATGSLLIVASVVPPIAAVEGAPELLVRSDEFRAQELDAAEAVAKDVAASVSGALVETLVTAGSPATTLADIAASADVELVVVGHRGRNALARALLGSVADRLVQISPKPVLVVR